MNPSLSQEQIMKALDLLEKEILHYERKLRAYSWEKDSSPAAFGERLYLAGLKQAHGMIRNPSFFPVGPTQ